MSMSSKSAVYFSDDFPKSRFSNNRAIYFGIKLEIHFMYASFYLKYIHDDAIFNIETCIGRRCFTYSIQFIYIICIYSVFYSYIILDHRKDERQILEISEFLNLTFMQHLHIFRAFS